MARRFSMMCAAGLLVTQCAWAADLKTTTVSKDEAQSWIRYASPLPKKIDLAAKVALPAADVAIQVNDESVPLAQQAIKELREIMGLPESAQAPAQPAFRLSLELGGPDSAKLKDLPRSDQAYLIEPTANGDGLRLIALAPRGLYYAAKTLQQFIKAKAHDGQVEIPMLRVTDWPDMQDRGMWGGDTSKYFRWISDHKMNYLEHISHTGVDKNKKTSVFFSPYKRAIIDEGPTYGIEPVPVVLHLEQLKGMGLFEAYPEFQGKDADEGVVCYSNPKFSEVLAEWLVLWGKTPNVTEVDVWMAENMWGKKACQCDECKKTERAILEARSIVKAWEIAKKQVPTLGLRILTSEASESCNARIIPTLPKDVKIWYYHSLFSYNTSHTPMIGKFQPYLIDAIKAGRWVGVCPNICAIVSTWTPMSSPMFIHARMNEYVDKGLEGLLGFAVPEIPHCQVNTDAAAEWSWNAKGRSTREFALSFAVRSGYKDPEKFADWCDAMGPVSWDVYGSEFPSGELRDNPGKLADLLKKGKVPGLGDVLWDTYSIPFGDIKTVEQLNNDIAQAEKGVTLAREIGIPEYVHESLVVQGYINAIKAIYELKQIVKPDGVTDKDAAAKWFRTYITGLKQARENLPLWEKALPGNLSKGNVVEPAVKVVTGMIDSMDEVRQEVLVSRTISRGGAKVDITRNLVDSGGTLTGIIEVYRMNTGQYPKELKDLVEEPADKAVAAKWRGPYIKDFAKVKDAWGQDLKYKCPGQYHPDAFDLWSVGPDGKDGTDDDITNWIREKP